MDQHLKKVFFSFDTMFRTKSRNLSLEKKIGKVINVWQEISFSYLRFTPLPNLFNSLNDKPRNKNSCP